MRDALAPTTLTLNPRKIPFVLANGQARSQPTAFETPQGRAVVETSLDLTSARFMTDWRIEASAKPGVTGKPKARLPAVVLNQSGSLANLAEADSKLSLSAFEPELGLRKLERDAEELERLRKLDDERRQKDEAERAAKLAAEAAAEAAAHAAEVAPGVGGVPAGVPQSSGLIPPQAGAPVEPASALHPSSAGPVPAIAASPQQTAEPVVPPISLARPPAQASPLRRRAQEGIQQPFQNNF